jgi:hypothetical protein
VQILASNSVSSATTNITVTITANLMGLGFKSGSNSLYSTSVVSQSANFLFVMLSGANYQCLIDYGDGQTGQLSDTVYNLNNTLIPHTFTTAKNYTVAINCTNPVNSLNLTFVHIVQYALTGLKLTSNGSLVGQAYKVPFSVSAGSRPYQITFLFDNVADSAVNYANLAGTSSTHSAESVPTIHQIYISLSNFVSSVQLNASYEISSPIVNAKFTIVPTSNIPTGAYNYLYSTQLLFQISMTSGSNVKLNINTDSLNAYSSLSLSSIMIQTVGNWFNSINDLTNRYGEGSMKKKAHKIFINAHFQNFQTFFYHWLKKYTINDFY